MLCQLTDEEYHRSLAVFNNCSIGQHTRHVIEFFVELEQGYEQGFVDYNQRKRDTILETNRQAAIASLQEIVTAPDRPDKSMRIAIYNQGNEPSAVIATSYHRELAFLVDHTVHHMALIRIGVEQLQTVAVPPTFGVAASTQQHLGVCAQ